MPIFPGFSKDDSLYAASHAYAIELANGKTAAEAERLIGNRYRNLNSADVTTATKIGQAFRDSAVAYESGVAQIVGGVTVASVDPTQPNQYRYVTVAGFEDRTIGKTSYRNVVVDSDVPLSQPDLAQEVADELGQGQSQLGRASLPGGSGVDYSTLSVNVASFTTQS